MTASDHTHRTESDFGGDVNVPVHAFYGAQTQRAVEAFTISSLRLPRNYLAALGALKRAAAQVNQRLGLLEPQVAAAIIRAASEVESGQLDDHFVVDVFQTGSATNTNMNANEVIANRANQLLGQPLGTKYPVHPNDHVNKGQSSNDVTPTVIHLAATTAVQHGLLPALEQLRTSLSDKAMELHDVLKTGRTHLQDAVPIRLGQEFRGYTGQIERATARIRDAQNGLAEVALGGTAIGTGINTHPDFATEVCRLLAVHFDVRLCETENHFQAQSSLDATVQMSAALKTLSVSLLKIANDVRWMNSGPRAGLREIEMPTLAMGSSIMPGKTNPIIAEAVCQVAAKVIGNDSTITIAGQHGNFEINVMMPVAAYALLESIALLTNSCRVFATLCIDGITATDTGPASVERGLMMATALSPRIGYDHAAQIARHAHASGSTIREVALTNTNLTSDEIDDLLDPSTLSGP
jgi:fumarate hydratase class II